jgi:hypothetical protein
MPSGTQSERRGALPALASVGSVGLAVALLGGAAIAGGKPESAERPRTDMGAVVELAPVQQTVRSIEVVQVRSADLDADGVVGPADRDRLLERWGTADEVADLNADGTVDGFDLGLLLGGWSR